MRFSTLCLLFVTLLLPSVRAEVRVVGCDLLGKDFSAELIAYSKLNNLGVKLDLVGSALGLEQLKTDAADLGLIFFAPGDIKLENPFMVVPVAYQTAIVVVPESLPLNQISFEQLSAIYCDQADLSIKRWGDLNVTGEWANRNILPNITGPSGGLSYDLFRYTVLRTPILKPIVAQQDSSAATLKRILSDEGGIAIIPMLPEKQSGLKALAIAQKSNDVTFGPTPENIQSGDYPLRLPLCLVFKKSSAKHIQPVLRYLLSEEAVPFWKKSGLVPLTIQARNQEIFDLEVL